MPRLIDLVIWFLRLLTGRQAAAQRKADDAVAQAAVDRPSDEQTLDALRKGKF